MPRLKGVIQTSDIYEVGMTVTKKEAETLKKQGKVAKILFEKLFNEAEPGKDRNLQFRIQPQSSTCKAISWEVSGE